MPKFKIRIDRDASVSFTATVEAENFQEVRNNLSRHGYGGPIIGDWEEDEPNVYDNVENYEIADANGKPIISGSY